VHIQWDASDTCMTRWNSELHTRQQKLKSREITNKARSLLSFLWYTQESLSQHDAFRPWKKGEFLCGNSTLGSKSRAAFLSLPMELWRFYLYLKCDSWEWNGCCHCYCCCLQQSCFQGLTHLLYNCSSFIMPYCQFLPCCQSCTDRLLLPLTNLLESSFCFNAADITCISQCSNCYYYCFHHYCTTIKLLLLSFWLAVATAWEVAATAGRLLHK